jgi:hypothetical protein
MNAPLTLILTLPGRVIVLSISSVEVIVLGRVRGTSSKTAAAVLLLEGR